MPRDRPPDLRPGVPFRRASVNAVSVGSLAAGEEHVTLCASRTATRVLDHLRDFAVTVAKPRRRGSLNCRLRAWRGGGGFGLRLKLGLRSRFRQRRIHGCRAARRKVAKNGRRRAARSCRRNSPKSRFATDESKRVDSVAIRHDARGQLLRIGLAVGYGAREMMRTSGGRPPRYSQGSGFAISRDRDRFSR